MLARVQAVPTDLAEMQTGEGRTLVATIRAYLNALTGRGVHVVAVNPFLAKRNAAHVKPGTGA